MNNFCLKMVSPLLIFIPNAPNPSTWTNAGSDTTSIFDPGTRGKEIQRFQLSWYFWIQLDLFFWSTIQQDLSIIVGMTRTLGLKHQNWHMITCSDTVHVSILEVSDFNFDLYTSSSGITVGMTHVPRGCSDTFPPKKFSSQ